MEPKDRIFDLTLKGYCCSQIITAMILEDMDKENQDMIDAMGGFCNGMESGETCGTLIASIAMLFMVDTKAANQELRADFMDWYYDIYGSYSCRDIVHDDPAQKMEVCPVMIENCYNMLRELLEDKIPDVD